MTGMTLIMWHGSQLSRRVAEISQIMNKVIMRTQKKQSHNTQFKKCIRDTSWYVFHKLKSKSLTCTPHLSSSIRSQPMLHLLIQKKKKKQALPHVCSISSNYLSLLPERKSPILISQETKTEGTMSNAIAHIKVAARPQNKLRENRKQGPGQGQDGGWKWVKPPPQKNYDRTSKMCRTTQKNYENN